MAFPGMHRAFVDCISTFNIPALAVVHLQTMWNASLVIKEEEKIRVIKHKDDVIQSLDVNLSLLRQDKRLRTSTCDDDLITINDISNFFLHGTGSDAVDLIDEFADGLPDSVIDFCVASSKDAVASSSGQP